MDPWEETITAGERLFRFSLKVFFPKLEDKLLQLMDQFFGWYERRAQLQRTEIVRASNTIERNPQSEKCLANIPFYLEHSDSTNHRFRTLHDN
jgi:hypothetical protein